jgi:FkbH-like protein
VLELVNKTNQFNLNGRRFTEAQWRAVLDRPGAFLLRVAYQDRFGPLGKIAVVAGRREGDTVHVEAWVMSCRAFARRIEYQCLRTLFERFQATAMVFDYNKTDRNGPVQDLFAGLLGTSPPGTGLHLLRTEFETGCPPLRHDVREVPDG